MFIIHSLNYTPENGAILNTSVCSIEYGNIHRLAPRNADSKFKRRNFVKLYTLSENYRFLVMLLILC